ncbi:phosphate ABC transporter permease [Moorena producens PAL-8-15-08-1]|uniref:Phosphate ABC transporter permease n=1 Tax=Moorena producens PAL-8-15-08-1 TaxID=1458985 RepID=A0A1D8TNK9_9CYAN|nr:ABC transporter permease subunit [Moorena producens]AOW99237.1 phosphate ABC transporter permease [Moorena producens PAL-8-15-08-1]
MTQSLSRPPLLNRSLLWGICFVIFIGMAVVKAGIFEQDLVNVGGFYQLLRFLRASLHPEVSPEFLQLTLKATLTTLAYAACGTFLSILLGVVAGVITSQVWWLTVLPHWTLRQPIWLGIRGLLAFPRAIHEMIWGIFFVSIWGLDPLAAIMAIAIPYGAIVAKVFSEILDETPRGALMALLSSGVSPLMAFLYSIIPQAFSNLLSYTLYRFECSIRSATVLGLVGAGGLGYEILLSLQSLRYEQLWTFFYALVLLSAAIDISSVILRRRINLTVVLILVALCCLGFLYVSPDLSKFWSPRTQKLLGDIAQASFPLDFKTVPLSQLWKLSLQTLVMSVLASAGSGLVGIVLSFPAAHNFLLPGGLLNPSPKASRLAALQGWSILVFTRIILLFGRAIPAPIWALVVMFVMFPGVLPGAIALGLHNLGILGRLMAEINENLEKPPLEALKAQGTPGALLFLYGIFPMNLPRFLAYIFYRWEVCMRETVIVGLVGAGGLGVLLTEQLSSFDYPSVGMTLVCFVFLTFFVDWVSAAARESITPHKSLNY